MTHVCVLPSVAKFRFSVATQSKCQCGLIWFVWPNGKGVLEWWHGSVTERLALPYTEAI